MHHTRLRLGQLLVDARILTPEQLEQVLALQRVDGRRLGTLLVEIGLVTETQLTQILSQQLSVPWVSLYHIEFSRELLSRVPRETAERYCLVPIYVRPVRGLGDTLYVAMDDPMNEEALAACSKSAGLPTRAMIAAPSDIRKAIRLYYAGARSMPGAVRSLPPPPRVAHRAIDVDSLEEVEPQPDGDDNSSSPASSGVNVVQSAGASAGPSVRGSATPASASAGLSVRGSAAPSAGVNEAGSSGNAAATGSPSLSASAGHESEKAALGAFLTPSGHPKSSSALGAASPFQAGSLAEASPGPLSEAVAAASSHIAAAAAAALEAAFVRAGGSAATSGAAGPQPLATSAGPGGFDDDPATGRMGGAQRAALEHGEADRGPLERARPANKAGGDLVTSGGGDSAPAAGSEPTPGIGDEATGPELGMEQDLAAAFTLGVAGAEPAYSVSVGGAREAGSQSSSWDVPNTARMASEPAESPSVDDGPEVEAHEIEVPRRRRGKGLSLTLLDGTTIPLGPLHPKRSRPAPRGDDLTGAEVLAMLRAAYRAHRAKEGAAEEELRWEKILAALLALLIRKHLVLESELIEEIKKL